jgi:phosphoribosylanthranilate isomerase
MTIKVCGITSREDAVAAVACGATALGFNFYPRSPRCVEPETAREMGAGLPVLKVGVFVNEPAARVAEILRVANLDVAQLHGDEGPAQYPAGARVWKAVRVDSAFDMRAWDTCPAEALLLDGQSSGKSFDWHLAAQAAHKIIVAGGLDAGNVARAIALARPWGVDACSKLESAPGKKDHAKMAAFVKAAREAAS